MKETDMFERKTGEDSSGSVTYFINTVRQDVLCLCQPTGQLLLPPPGPWTTLDPSACTLCTSQKHRATRDRFHFSQ